VAVHAWLVGCAWLKGVELASGGPELDSVLKRAEELVVANTPDRIAKCLLELALHEAP